MIAITLKKSAERRILAGHLWIFSNDIASPLKQHSPGDCVMVETSFGKPIAIGYINPHCLLCVRILTLNTHDIINVDFFVHKIKIALAKRALLFNQSYYRAIFGESDRLPGLVVDRFNNTLVVQLNTAGAEKLKSIILDAINIVFNPIAIFLKCDSSERNNEGLETYTEIVKGELPKTIMIPENNCLFVTLTI